MSDIAEFLQSYNETLRQEIAGADMPPELTERFTFDSCVKRQDGREVYFLTQKSDSQRAVLRITNADSGENVAAESAILAKLDHPAIPKTLGVWEHNGRSFLIREYFGGDDLHTYIQKHGTLSLDMLTDITLRLCDVLSYIHSQSPAVIHRDIKPENIIIAGKNGVKLIDFGIARDFRQEAEKDTQIAGTRPYMAPEQFGSEQTDNRADIYSLGVVMIFMATGKPDKQNLKTAYPYKELVSVIEKCIKKDRDQRYKNAERLKKSILRIKRHTTRKIILGVAAVAAVTAAFLIGSFTGEQRGFNQGVDWLMSSPAVIIRQYTAEELTQPVVFENWNIDVAIRNILNKSLDEQMTLGEVLGYVVKLQIYGNHAAHPALQSTISKTHIGKDEVIYSTSGGYTVIERGEISNLSDVTQLYYLRELELISQSISDLSPLSGMSLERLDISNNFVGNLMPLKDMATLRELCVCQNPLDNLTPVSRLLSLEALDISQTQVTDLTPLAGLTKLKALKLNYCDVKDISVLSKLPALLEVDLSNTFVTDLTPLVRPENPITVRCAGLPDEVVKKVRDMDGIVIVDE